MEIKPQFEHSKFGNFMFKFTASSTKFLIKHKWLYYLLSFTWGLIMTFIGLLTTVFIYIFVKEARPKKYHWIHYTKVGPDYWGGLSLGISVFKDQKSSEQYINNHEFGHTFQNCILGPLTPFLITIPSACRYWYQTIRANKGKINEEYDAFWAEDSATQCGEYVNWYLNSKNKTSE